MDPLPLHATEASRTRYSLALELAQQCPSSLVRAVALSGSVSRGVADSDSDIEMNFWADTIPPESVRAAWYASVGATDIDPGGISPAGTAWDMILYRGVWVEAGWQTVKTATDELDSIIAAETVDHERLMLADVIARAVPLHGENLPAEWKSLLVQYPDALQKKLIDDAIWLWLRPLYVSLRWAMYRRGQQVALTGYLLDESRSILRLLCALNRRWEPDWKWLAQLAEELPIKPDRIIRRMEQVFSVPDTYARIEQSTRLALDALALVPDTYNVAPAVEVLSRSLYSGQG